MKSTDVTSIALDGLTKYFSHIENTGYARKDDIQKLLGLCLVDMFLNTELSVFVTEDDYRTISDFLYCMYGTSCLIPYRQFLDQVGTIGKALPGWSGLQPGRITENIILRFTENTDPELRYTEAKTEFWDNQD